MLVAEQSSVNDPALASLAIERLVVYQNTALVTAQISEALQSSNSVLSVELPETVSLDSIYVTPTQGFSVTRMSLAHGLEGGELLLHRYLDQPVGLRLDQGHKQAEPARLRSLLPLLVETQQGLQRVNLEQLVLPEMAQTRLPRLNLEVIGKGVFGAELAFFNPAIGWSADYEMTFDSQEQQVMIRPWVTLTNGSGISVTAPEASLIAGGAPERSPVMPYPEMRMASAMAMDSPVAKASQTGLQYRWSLADGVNLDAYQEIRQPLSDAWIAAATLKQRRETRVNPSPTASETPQPLETVLEVRPFAGLDPSGQAKHPLAAGRVRVFQHEEDATRLYLGEASLGQTAPEQVFEIALGASFDVSVTRSIDHFRIISDRVREVGVALRVSNAGSYPAVIELIERMPGDFSILERTTEVGDKQNQSLPIRFALSPESEREVRYRVRLRY